MKQNKKETLRIKILALSTAISILGASIKVMAYQKEKKDLLKEQYELLQEYKELLLEYKDINTNTEEENEISEEEYNINDILEVGGRTIYMVSDITPTPPPQVISNIDTSSIEYMMNEDGYLKINEEEQLSLTFNTIEEMISFYCKVFQLNEEIITEKINSLINDNYYSWQYGNMINGISYETVEEAISRTISNISYDPTAFDLLEEDIRIEDYELEQYLPEELIYKFSEVIGVNPNIALSIAYAESGRALDSYNFTHNHNVAGIHPRANYISQTTSEGYVIYNNEADGLFRFILLLHDDYGVNVDSNENKINSMASTFCSVPNHWINLVGSIYRELNSNGYDYSYNTYTYKERDLIYPKAIQYTLKK